MNLDILIPILSRMFVEESEGVHELMNHDFHRVEASGGAEGGKNETLSSAQTLHPHTTLANVLIASLNINVILGPVHERDELDARFRFNFANPASNVGPLHLSYTVCLVKEQDYLRSSDIFVSVVSSSYFPYFPISFTKHKT